MNEGLLLSVDVPYGQLSETVHRRGLLPRHAHEPASFCLVTQGSVAERTKCSDVTFGEGDVIFRQPDEWHSNTFHAATTRCFNVLFDPALLARAGEGRANPAAAGPILRRLLRYCRRGGSGLTAEGLVLQVIGETFRAPPVRRSLAAETARIIDARFAEPLTIRSIAAELSTHPVHLARTFKQERGTGICETIRALRIREAQRLLSEGKSSLAEIAHALGFADQSHFTKTFRKVTGRTPGNARER